MLATVLRCPEPNPGRSACSTRTFRVCRIGRARLLRLPGSGRDELQQLGPGPDTELLVDAAEMAPHRDLGDPERLSDLPGGHSLAESLDDVPLSWRELDAALLVQLEMATALASTKLVDQATDEPARYRRLAAHDPANHVRQARRVDALRDVSGRAGPDGGDEFVLVDPARHDDDHGSRHLRGDLGRGADSTPGRAEVDHANVGMVTNSRCDGSVGVLRLGDLGRAGQGEAYTGARREVVGRDQDARIDLNIGRSSRHH